MIDEKKILTAFYNYLQGKDVELLNKMSPMSITSDIKGLELHSAAKKDNEDGNEDWITLVKYWREFNLLENYLLYIL